MTASAVKGFQGLGGVTSESAVLVHKRDCAHWGFNFSNGLNRICWDLENRLSGPSHRDYGLLKVSLKSIVGS